MEEFTDLLFSMPVFNSIPSYEQADFMDELAYRSKTFNKGDTLFIQGDTVNALFVLFRGSVRAEMASASGTVLQIETITAPQLLAPAFIFASDNSFPVDVIALESCELITISTRTLQTLFNHHPTFLKSYLNMVSNRAQFLSKRLDFLNIKTIKGKLAHHILSNSKDKHFTLAMNQSNLSDYFGVARPSLARALSEIVQEKIITLNKNNGEILDVKRLKELMF